jgi:hypothetical protein
MINDAPQTMNEAPQSWTHPAHGSQSILTQSKRPLEMITGAQIREARKLLGWSPLKLAGIVSRSVV